MDGDKRLFYLLLRLLGLMMVIMTVFVILLQCYFEINLFLTFLCATSWILFIIAAFQTMIPEKEYDYVAGQRSFNDSDEIETETK